VSWWRKEQPETPQPKPRVLEPGECECGHGRCFHKEGVGECACAITTDQDDRPIPKEQWGSCACVIYIPDDEDDDGDTDEPVSPSSDELERMFK
jgi:hypothetical protein